MRLFRRITGTASGEREDLFAEIGRLTDANRDEADPETERRLLRLRHHAGLQMLAGNGGRPEHPSPDFEQLPEAEVLPELSPSQVTPELLRAGILRDGCLLVRGLVERDRAVRFADEIDRSFRERERLQAGDEPAEGYYEEFEPEPPHVVPPDQRTWIQSGGGVLAVDSPRLAAEMLDMFQSAGVTRLVEGYLGERPVLSLEKTTLRKAEPQVSGAWHQDGRFMGDVRALNLWLSLSRCGDESPGLDIVPKRIEDIVTTNTDEATIEIQISQSKAEEAAGDTPIVRPIFEPGDALFFDDLFLHKTGSDPSMPKPRYAIESWFFGASAFPEAYGPVAV